MRRDAVQDAERVSTALGWFSIGLGLMEIAAPASVARFAGMQDRPGTRNLVRAFGAREIGAGIGILLSPRDASRVWARVAGDALDVSGLAVALADEGTDRSRAIMATIAVLGVTAVDIACAVQLGPKSIGSVPAGTMKDVSQAITVNAPTDTVFDFWRELSNLPRVMTHLKGVQVELLDEVADERLSWRVTDHAGRQSQGTVSFRPAPGGRGTEVRVRVERQTVAVPRMLSRLVGQSPEQRLRADLSRFKQIIEAGDVARSDGPSLWRPARPTDAASAMPASHGVLR